MKSPLTHLLLASVACALVLTGYGFWYAAIANKSAAVAALQENIEAKSETMKRLSAARMALAEIVDDEAAVQRYFVSETEAVAFIDSLESRGRFQGATVHVLSVSTARQSVPPALALSLSVLGTFDAVMRTVGAIEYAPYALSITKFSVGRSGTESGWLATLDLQVGSTAARSTPKTP